MWFWDLLGNILGFGLGAIIAFVVWIGVLGYFIENGFAGKASWIDKLFWGPLAFIWGLGGIGGVITLAIVLKMKH